MSDAAQAGIVERSVRLSIGKLGTSPIVSSMVVQAYLPRSEIFREDGGVFESPMHGISVG